MKALLVEQVIEKNMGVFLAYKNLWDEGVGNELVRVYRNPKSLYGFEPGIRAISDYDGNLYVADIGTMHTDLEKALMTFSQHYSRLRKEHPGYVGDWQRKGLTNEFYIGESWGFSGYIDADEHDLKMIKYISKKAQEKNPQFKFNYNETIIGVGREKENWDLIEG